MQAFQRAVAVVLLALLVGCASVPKQAFNRAAHTDIKSIAVLDPASGDEYPVNNLGHAGMSFGLIGGLIAAADMHSKTTAFTNSMKGKGFNLVSEYRNSVLAELGKAGYAVKLLPVTRPKPEFLASYDGLDPSVDAYLDLGVWAGYLCASGTADYVPFVRTGARLVKRGSKEVLYQDLISYGYELRAGEAVSIAADKKYFFKDFPALTSDSDRALEGMRVGIPIVTQRIAQDLAPQASHAAAR